MPVSGTSILCHCNFVHVHHVARKRALRFFSDDFANINYVKKLYQKIISCNSNQDREIPAGILAKPGQNVYSAQHVSLFPDLIQMCSNRLAGLHVCHCFLVRAVCQPAICSGVVCLGLRFFFFCCLDMRGAFACK